MKPAKNSSVKRRRRWPLTITGLIAVLIVGPLLASSAVYGGSNREWWSARRDATGLAPDPATTPEAVVQVYAARAFGWRGAFGVHTWIAVKQANADHYVRLEVIGWGVGRGGSAVRVRRGDPDGYWYGSYPEVLTELRGEAAEGAIEKIAAAAKSYPHPAEYTVWPGPNSNTFTAYVGRQVPELRLDLPPTAVGKDYLPGGNFAASTPSGTGFQVSLFGLLGLAVGVEEGIELNLLGLNLGIDVKSLGLRLPGIGSVNLI